MAPWQAAMPDPERIWAHVERIFEQGVRRPDHPADRWTEDYVERTFRELGLDAVRREPVTLRRWEDHEARLHVGGEPVAPAFAVPFSEPGTVEAPLARYDVGDPSAVAGKVAVHDVRLMAMPAAFPAWARTAGNPSGATPPTEAGWAFDPDDTFNGEAHLLPFAREMQEVMDGAIAAGAVGYIGVHDLPGGGCSYYVPYDGEDRAVPGVYVDGAAAARLTGALDAGATATVTVDASRTTATSHNIVGELAGADDEWVVVASHHDGPWASAVEDASGVALVLAQAELWAALPAGERPHRLVLSVNAGHMAGGAGTQAFIAAHRDRMDGIVLEIHLEHAASLGPEVAPEHPDRAVPRWWFTSEEPRLEQVVWDAMVAEGLDRSLLLAPTAFGPRPTTDGGFFHDVGVPLVNYLTAPWYLFDPRDDLAKVHRPSLTGVTGATARIVAATGAWSAAGLRAGVRPQAG
jgi:hypothetical protein